ncbi:MAG TPA: M24 family metallopeptidase, partial [Terriglobales bacterium]|nr:M24 family metallopeptidase [Terriglobales bacterium]
MSIDGELDLAGLKEIGRIVAQTIRAMQAAVRPGVSTAELDQVAAREFRKHGAVSSPRRVYAFP